ncbi:hypothetical protein RGAI101_605 [Roseobacter sp. GAI101]|nr:hypothetical protein RGAI101_605 [Roseobacter sp. GAI101]
MLLACVLSRTLVETAQISVTRHGMIPRVVLCFYGSEDPVFRCHAC